MIGTFLIDIAVDVTRTDTTATPFVTLAGQILNTGFAATYPRFMCCMPHRPTARASAAVSRCARRRDVCRIRLGERRSSASTRPYAVVRYAQCLASGCANTD
jgi:hypothetical protein